MVPPCPYIMRMVAIRHTRGAKKYNLLLLRGRHHRCCSGEVVITQNYPLNCFWVSFTSANVVEIWAAYSSKYIFLWARHLHCLHFSALRKYGTMMIDWDTRMVFSSVSQWNVTHSMRRRLQLTNEIEIEMMAKTKLTNNKINSQARKTSPAKFSLTNWHVISSKPLFVYCTSVHTHRQFKQII